MTCVFQLRITAASCCGVNFSAILSISGSTKASLRLGLAIELEVLPIKYVCGFPFFRERIISFFFSLLTIRPFLPRPISKMRIYSGLCFFNWGNIRAWTAHGLTSCMILDCARDWTEHGTGPRTGLDWDIRVEYTGLAGTNGWQNSSMYDNRTGKALESPHRPDSWLPRTLFHLGRLQ